MNRPALDVDGPATYENANPGVTLGRIVLLVRDYDEALAFYRDALGAAPLFDRTAGDQRFLHVGFPGDGAAIWFLQPADDDQALVGRQAGGQPLLVLYTEDLRAMLARFTTAGGRIRTPEREEDGNRFAHVEDLYGNELVLVQLGGS